MQTKLAVVAGPLRKATEMGTHAYVLHSLLGEACLVVQAILPLVAWIDRNWTVWVRLMADQETMTRFAYDVLWIVLAYLNDCILASTAATEGDPGARILVSFRYLIDELDHGRYTGRTPPRSIQYLLIVRTGRLAALTSSAALPPPASQYIDVDGIAGGGGGAIVPRGRRRNNRDGEIIPNPRPIQRLCILGGENKQGMCWDVELPTLGGVDFCKRWHMGYTCFGDFLRAASHLHPAGGYRGRGGSGNGGRTSGQGGDDSTNLTSGKCQTGPACFPTRRRGQLPRLQRKIGCALRQGAFGGRKLSVLTGAGGH